MLFNDGELEGAYVYKKRDEFFGLYLASFGKTMEYVPDKGIQNPERHTHYR